MSQTKAQLIGDLTQALEFITTASTPAEGLYLKATNQIALATNSVDRITAGTSELVINESGASVDFRVEGDTDANLLFVDASTNRIGVGTTSPQTQFVVSNGGAQGLEVGWDGSTSQFIQAYNRSGSAWIPIRIQGSDIRFNISGSTNEKARIDSSGRLLVGTSSEINSTPLLQTANTSGGRLALGRNENAPTVGNTIGSVETYGNAGGTYDLVGALYIDCDASHTSSSKPTRLTFHTTASSATSPTERMRIDSSGRLGIGTNSPSADYFSTAQLVHISGANNAAIKFERTSATARKWEIGCATGGSFDIADTVFSTSTPRLRIDTSGNVGIGASSPQAPLVVYNSAASMRFQNSTTGATATDGLFVGLNAGNGDTAYVWNYENDDLIFGTNNSERTRIDSSGRLLVGTSTAAGNNILQLEGSASGDTEWAGISLRRGIASASLVADQYLGAIAFQSQGGGEGAVIRGVVESSWTSSSHPSRLTFETTESGSSSSTERMRINNSGSVLIDCTSLPGGSTKGAGFYPDTNNVQLLLASSSTSATAHVEFFNTNGKVGTITTSGSSTSYNTSSDYRLKENVVDLNGAIDRVKQLAPKRFNFISDETDTLVDGFLAHEAQAVVPEAVTGTHDEVDDENSPVYQGIDQSKLVPLLTAALQEAIGKIEALETKMAALEAN